ncbi:hypothetical protein EJ110_NYTH54523 [Nymphaea thermarum]|nr:hypothetical protein EJ110_NYTH54523 [Nymphaea thermarum]
MVKEYENFNFRQPYQQAMYYSSIILEDNPWPGSEKLEALVHLVAEDLSKFSHLLLSTAFFECHAAGNIGPSEAETLVIDIEKYASWFLTNRIVKLQITRSHFYPVQYLNQNNENSALLFYLQVDPDVLVPHTKPQLIVLVAKQPNMGYRNRVWVWTRFPRARVPRRARYPRRLLLLLPLFNLTYVYLVIK